MIKLEHTTIYGWEAAIRGMRNPMNSWDKSDSTYGEVGEADLKLMKSLSKAGNDHAKFLRFINVTVDITAPRYWWTEADTYRVGKEQNSCSTMHKIHTKKFELDDFSHEHLTHYSHDGELCRDWLGDLEDLIDDLNFAREKYLETKDKIYWWQMIQLLPQSYNQKRTVQLSYQVLKTMYHARKNHRLDEWREFCKWCESLPYFRELCIDI